ncbi:MAG: transcription elongation factor GreA [Erysipelotrichia bacterium]|jgi:transcription elongation factor GreA|nr:transcription elongation factor GreA [Bacilli bacterium]MDD4006106.1 transcription elongation factor GreA [Bacilli bacterium]NMV82268.1 transcription elongation factor GreA [Erysipelotrichia bacterium]
MVDNKVILTKDGVKKLKEELRHLIDVERPEVIEQLTFARSQGDLSENADYDAARSRQAEVEGRIKQIEDILANAKIIDNKPKNSKCVTIGSKVAIRDLSLNRENTYTIVGTVEANPFAGKISNDSLLGSALIGKQVGDLVTVKTANPYEVEILRIEHA